LGRSPAECRPGMGCLHSGGNLKTGHWLRTVSLTALLLVAGPLAHAQSALRIAYPEFWPFFTRDNNGRMSGFFYEIVMEAVERRLGISLVWETFPWPRCQELVRQGRYDAMLTVPTPERSAYTLTHPDPFYLKSLNVFTFNGHPQMERIKQIRNLADIKNGGFTLITYSTNGWNKENVEAIGIRVLETANLKSVWRMLSGKRGDIVIEWPQGAWPDIRAAGVAFDVVQTDVVIESMPFHLLIGKASAHAGILNAFNRVVVEMKADGTMDRILKAYE